MTVAVVPIIVGWSFLDASVKLRTPPNFPFAFVKPNVYYRRLSVIGYQLSVIGYQLSVIGYRLSLIEELITNNQ